MNGQAGDQVLTSHVHKGLNVDVEGLDLATNDGGTLCVPDLLAEGERGKQIAKRARGLAPTTPSLGLVASELEVLPVLREPRYGAYVLEEGRADTRCDEATRRITGKSVHQAVQILLQQLAVDDSHGLPQS